ncbi:hypothetical protein EDD27_3195 [Nonomuraea polychroma]|uniref:Uncharacterized protein n=1 Tax=Nonomuraea polychroma TaxID=46176 RepID=A0A438M4I5_9ACTN|nr:hypothetical protein [Nonomuraea polychroma]RVX40770.1 hypothetical protein EDD27_3195 [Nonomuraea polychroma]
MLEDLSTYVPLLFVAFGMLIILGSIKRVIGGKRFAGRAQRVPGVVSDVRTTFAGQGNATEVLYDPQDPTRTVPADNAGGGYGAIVFGLIPIVIGLVFFAGIPQALGAAIPSGRATTRPGARSS